jgi:hypothetical protein
MGATAGGGGRVIKTYAPGDLTPGASLPVSFLGVGGAGGSGGVAFFAGTAGTNGSITFIWNESALYNVPGTYTFIVPNYTTLTVTIDGASGGGGSSSGTIASGGLVHPGNDGGAGAGITSFQAVANLVAQSATGGTGAPNASSPGSNGTNGTASGGTINTTGGGNKAGKGGISSNTNFGGFGGIGGFVSKTFAKGDLTPGSGITVKVGTGGTGASAVAGDNPISNPGDAGSNGSVNITWTGTGTHSFAVFIG